MLGAYVATRAGTFIFTPIATTSGVCASLLVAFKQIHPDVTLGMGNVIIPASYFPLCYLAIMVLLTILKLTPIGVLFFAGCALQVAWTYLRFFRKAQDGTYGDRSDSFAYSALYPQVMKPVISPIASLTYIMWSPVLSKWQQAEPISSLPAVHEPSKGSDRDAERRRQRALLALEEKLKADAAKEEDNAV
ncbi:rhomboid family protein [Gracilaria domingensis]|nr:rhomboid family protein [Gracilaria domingensis]